MKKTVFLIIGLFIIGFSSLLYYVISYNNNLEQKYSSESTENITEDEISKLPGNSYSEKYADYANEVLNETSEKSEDEITELYKTIIDKINILAIGFDYDEISNVAYNSLNEEPGLTPEMYSNLTSLSMIYGFGDMSDREKLDLIGTVKEPVVFMSMFYGLKPEYQSFLLGNENFTIIPINKTVFPSLVEIKQGFTVDSRASEHFSDLKNVDVTEIKLEVSGNIYSVYVAGKEGSQYKITNVETEASSRTTYSDYFKIWGKEEIDLYYD